MWYVRVGYDDTLLRGGLCNLLQLSVCMCLHSSKIGVKAQNSDSRKISESGTSKISIVGSTLIHIATVFVVVSDV